MLDVLLVPLAGLLVTSVGLAIFYLLNYYIQFRRGYEEIGDPLPHIYTVADVNAICEKYKQLSRDLKALQQEGFRARDFLNRMKTLAMLVDLNARYLDDETEVFESANKVFTHICQQKRIAEANARSERIFRDKLSKTQIKILQLLPPEAFFSCMRMFLPPSPVHRVGVLLGHLKELRGVHGKRIKKEIVTRKRVLNHSQERCLVKKRRELYRQGSLIDAIARLRKVGGDGSKSFSSTCGRRATVE